MNPTQPTPERFCSRRLTKSRFVTGATCARKLYYDARPETYPQAPRSEFLQALADGGFQVGALAKALRGPGEEVVTLREDQAVMETQALMRRDEVTIFEGAFCVADENLLVRVDVLHKRGRSLRLLEVKAKSWDPRADRFFSKRGGVKKAWLPYLLDVAFQHYVLERCHPGATVAPALLLMDKSKACAVDGLHQRFVARKQRDEDSGRVRLQCIDRGRPAAQPMLVEVPAGEAVDYLRTAWRDDQGRTFGELVQDLAATCGDGRTQRADLGSKCKGCEFRVASGALAQGQESGFARCWSEHLQVPPGAVEDQPLGLDLWNNRALQEQLDRGLWRLRDLASELPWTGGGAGDAAGRRAVQVHVGAGLRPDPYVDVAALRGRLAQLEYPLHLIDFETAAVALPFVAGRRPYEQNAFQFSHHVLHEDGRLVHAFDWLDDAVGAFPNYRFVRALQESLGVSGGTLVHYAAHENTVLNQVRRQLLDDPAPPDDRPALLAFLEHWATPSGSEGGWAPRGARVDLCDWVRETFYDAAMGGSYSIKKVLPAVLARSPALQARFGRDDYGAPGGVPSRNFEGARWVRRGADGLVEDPYAQLPPVFSDAAALGYDQRLFDQSELREGGSASTAYARLQYEEMSEDERRAIRAALLRYCELDTLAMAMVFLHLQALADGAAGRPDQ